MLGSAKTGGHLYVITYRGNCVWFNFSHSPSGAPGALFWVKTTLYQYLTKKYGPIKAPADIKLPGTPVSQKETDLPDASKLPDDEPLKRYDGQSTKIGLGRFLAYLLNPFVKDNYYYEITIPSDSFMEYAKKVDGSPNTVFAAFLYKAIAGYFPSKGDDQLSGRIADDYRNDIGAQESYRDFTRLLHVKFTRSMENDSIEKLIRIARGAVILQMQPELSCERFRQIEEIHRGIDAQPDLKSKKKYAASHSLFRSDARDVFNVSYAGQTDWGQMTDYIDEVHSITDGDFMLEVNALPDKFCLTFQLINRDRKPLDLFCKVIDEEGLPYTVSEMKTRYLPDIELPNG
ncbi:hypothetical protein [Butyrivibrio sp. VCD2006]|uniref:hypothetical protein n=1 Tax=Butyrivibrio sp. VCD2006 TaxID=1280664 RepID=UPI00047BD5E7|nr:hypothetical protein [Butyrivibrio sp. VCD2006]